MARGIGIDAIEVSRITAARNRLGTPFERRVLSPAEADLLARSATPDLFLAGRFAAKEAVAKALGGRFGWHEVEILPEGQGAPRVNLRGRALDAGDGLDVVLTISHSRTVAAAVAIATQTSAK